MKTLFNSIFVAGNALLGPFYLKYHFYSPIIEQAEANARNGDPDLMHGSEYATLSQNYLDGESVCREAKINHFERLTDYLDYRVKLLIPTADASK